MGWGSIETVMGIHMSRAVDAVVVVVVAIVVHGIRARAITLDGSSIFMIADAGLA